MSTEEHAVIARDSIEYSTRVVAFLDVLGFTELVRQAANAVAAVDIILRLEQSLQHARGASSNIRVRMFSDCISMSSAPTPRGLEELFWRCIVLQGLLLRYGFLIRGAITEGLHYESDRLIFSEALVGSYQLEQAANYPRVIVSRNLAERAPTTVQLDGAPWSPARGLLLQDHDGMFFLDYFRFMETLSFIDAFRPNVWESMDLQHSRPPEGFVTPSKFLTLHQDLVQSGLTTHADNPRVLPKYGWMRSFQNRPDRYGQDI